MKSKILTLIQLIFICNCSVIHYHYLVGPPQYQKMNNYLLKKQFDEAMNKYQRNEPMSESKKEREIVMKIKEEFPVPKVNLVCTFLCNKKENLELFYEIGERV